MWPQVEPLPRWLCADIIPRQCADAQWCQIILKGSTFLLRELSSAFFFSFFFKSCNCFHDPKSYLMNKVFGSFISLYESDISIEDKPLENTQSTCDQRADLLHSGLIHAAETCSWRCNELFQKENIWQYTFYPQSDLLQSSVLQHWLGYVSVLDVLEEAVQFGAVDDWWAKQEHSTRVYTACFCKGSVLLAPLFPKCVLKHRKRQAKAKCFCRKL